jgi:hypothetical protein
MEVTFLSCGALKQTAKSPEIDAVLLEVDARVCASIIILYLHYLHLH